MVGGQARLWMAGAALLLLAAGLLAMPGAEAAHNPQHVVSCQVLPGTTNPVCAQADICPGGVSLAATNYGPAGMMAVNVCVERCLPNVDAETEVVAGGLGARLHVYHDFEVLYESPACIPTFMEPCADGTGRSGFVGPTDVSGQLAFSVCVVPTAPPCPGTGLFLELVAQVTNTDPSVSEVLEVPLELCVADQPCPAFVEGTLGPLGFVLCGDASPCPAPTTGIDSSGTIVVTSPDGSETVSQDVSGCADFGGCPSGSGVVLSGLLEAFACAEADATPCATPEQGVEGAVTYDVGADIGGPVGAAGTEPIDGCVEASDCPSGVGLGFDHAGESIQVCVEDNVDPCGMGMSAIPTVTYDVDTTPAQESGQEAIPMKVCVPDCVSPMQGGTLGALGQEATVCAEVEEEPCGDGHQATLSAAYAYTSAAGNGGGFQEVPVDGCQDVLECPGGDGLVVDQAGQQVTVCVSDTLTTCPQAGTEGPLTVTVSVSGATSVDAGFSDYVDACVDAMACPVPMVGGGIETQDWFVTTCFDGGPKECFAGGVEGDLYVEYFTPVASASEVVPVDIDGCIEDHCGSMDGFEYDDGLVGAKVCASVEQDDCPPPAIISGVDTEWDIGVTAPIEVTTDGSIPTTICI